MSGTDGDQIDESIDGKILALGNEGEKNSGFGLGLNSDAVVTENGKDDEKAAEKTVALDNKDGNKNAEAVLGSSSDAMVIKSCEGNWKDDEKDKSAAEKTVALDNNDENMDAEVVLGSSSNAMVTDSCEQNGKDGEKDNNSVGVVLESKGCEENEEIEGKDGDSENKDKNKAGVVLGSSTNAMVTDSCEQSGKDGEKDDNSVGVVLESKGYEENEGNEGKDKSFEIRDKDNAEVVLGSSIIDTMVTDSFEENGTDGEKGNNSVGVVLESKGSEENEEIEGEDGDSENRDENNAEVVLGSSPDAMVTDSCGENVKDGEKGNRSVGFVIESKGSEENEKIEGKDGDSEIRDKFEGSTAEKTQILDNNDAGVVLESNIDAMVVDTSEENGKDDKKDNNGVGVVLESKGSEENEGKDESFENRDKFAVSDLVWGKVRSHPWWPGQIFDPSDASENGKKYSRKDGLLIAYFRDKTFAWNEESKIKPFRENFVSMERQSKMESFSYAVGDALEEVSRRTEFGLACKCLSKEVYDEIKTQNIVNAGIRKESSRREGGDEYSSAERFVPLDLVGYVESLAKSPCEEINRVDFVTARAQLLAFKRHKGFTELPEFQMSDWYLGEAPLRKEMGPKGSSKKRKKSFSSPTSNSEEEINVFEKMGPKGSSTKRKKSFSSPTSDSEEEINVFEKTSKRRKADKNVSESSMVEDKKDLPSPVTKINFSDIGKRICSVIPALKDEGNSILLGCSRKKPGRKKAIPVEHLSPDEILSNLSEVAKSPIKGYSSSRPSVGFLSNMRNLSTLGKSSEFKKGMDKSSSKQDGEEISFTKNNAIPVDHLSPDEILSNLSEVAKSPIKGYSSLRPIVGFLSDMRNLSTLEKSSKFEKEMEKSSSKEDGEEISFTKEEDGEEISFTKKDDREELLKVEAAKPSVIEGLDKSISKKDGEEISFTKKEDGEEFGKVEAAEPSGTEGSQDSYWTDRVVTSNTEEGMLLETETLDGNTIISDTLDVNGNTSAELDPSSDRKVESADPVNVKCEEENPTSLILNFSDIDSVPSQQNLNNIFRRYGPLKETNSEVAKKSKRAKVTFKKRSDAETAFSSSGKFSIFGPALVSYRLHYLPAKQEKGSPARKRSKKSAKSVEGNDG